MHKGKLVPLLCMVLMLFKSFMYYKIIIIVLYNYSVCVIAEGLISRTALAQGKLSLVLLNLGPS